MRLLALTLGALVVCLALLAVGAAAAPARPMPAAVDPTIVQVTTPANLTLGTQTTLQATLLDAATNTAISGENLSFAKTTTFGSLLLGTVPTDTRGEARIPFSSAYAGTYTIVVSFAGNSSYAPSNGTITVTVLGGAATPPPPLPQDLVIVLVILAVVGGVWATYGAVAFLVLGIRGDWPERVRTPKGAEEAEVIPLLTEQESKEVAERAERALAKARAARRAIVIVAGLALVIGVALGIGVGNSMRGSATSTTPPPPEHLYLTIAYDPATGLDEFFPANFSVPANDPVTITITNYDNGQNPVSAADASVSGTVGGTETVQLWGQAPQNVTSVNTTQVSHTFSMLQGPYSLNVPIPASTSLAQPTVVTFTAVFTTTGTFTWRCLTPCDDVAMATPGFMQGTVTVL